MLMVITHLADVRSRAVRTSDERAVASFQGARNVEPT